MSHEKPTSRDHNALARWTDSALRQWPAPGAPEGFAAGVMARVRDAGTTPWFRRAWRDWPRGARWGFAWGMAGMAGLLAWAPWTGPHGALDGLGSEGLAGAVRFAGGIFRAGAKVVELGNGWLGRLPGPWMAALLGMLGALWVSVAGLGSVLWRFSREQA